MYDESNIFARILRGELPSHKLYEDDKCVVILDIFPITPGHALVIPKRKVVTMAELDDESAAHLMVIGARVAKALRAAHQPAGPLRCEAVNFWISDGAEAGQEVPHTHLHIIPRFQGDGFGFRMGPESRKNRPQDVLAGWAQLLKAKL